MLEASLEAMRKETGQEKPCVVGGNYTKEATKEVIQAVGGRVTSAMVSKVGKPPTHPPTYPPTSLFSLCPGQEGKTHRTPCLFTHKITNPPTHPKRP